MVSIAYINGTQDVLLSEMAEDSFTNQSNLIINAVEAALIDYHNKTNSLFVEKDIMGELSDEKKLILEKEEKSLVTKVGESIIKFFKMVESTFDKIITKFKEMISGDKSKDIDKMEYLIKKHPKLEEEIKLYFKENPPKLNDLKTLSELDSLVDDIVKMGKKSDPKSIRGRWEKIKEKLSQSNKSPAIIATASVVTILGLKKAVYDNMDHAQKIKKKTGEAYERLSNSGAITDDTGVATSNLKILQDIYGHTSKALNQNQTVLDKSINGVAGVIDKFFSKNKKAQYHYDKKEITRRSNEEKNQAIIDKTREAIAVKTAQVDSDLNYRLGHRDQYNTLTRDQEMAKRDAALDHEENNELRYRAKANRDADQKTDADLNAYRTHRNRILDRDYDKAVVQQQGRNDA